MTDTPERELIERLNDEAMRLQGRGIDRGCVDSSLAGNLAMEAADTIEALLSRVDKLEERVRAVQEVIENGYPKPERKCPHGRFYYEDCISCYDEALLDALNRSAS
jgi:hypothetical protein